MYLFYNIYITISNFVYIIASYCFMVSYFYFLFHVILVSIVPLRLVPRKVLGIILLVCFIAQHFTRLLL